MSDWVVKKPDGSFHIMRDDEFNEIVSRRVNAHFRKLYRRLRLCKEYIGNGNSKIRIN